MRYKSLLERLETMIHIAHETNCILTKIATPDAEEILELLKERESVKPKIVVQTGIHRTPTVEVLMCGDCHKIIDHTMYYYPYCRRKVKWND